MAALADGIRSDVLGSPIAVTTLFPGYIRSEMNEQVAHKIKFMVDTEAGCRAMVDAIEREVRRGVRATLALGGQRAGDALCAARRRAQADVTGTRGGQTRVRDARTVRLPHDLDRPVGPPLVTAVVALGLLAAACTDGDSADGDDEPTPGPTRRPMRSTPSRRRGRSSTPRRSEPPPTTRDRPRRPCRRMVDELR